MKNISITYQPFGLIKWHKSINGEFPTGWEDITPKQLIAISAWMKEALSEDRLLHLLSGIKLKVIKKLDDFQKYKIFELLAFINKPVPFHEFIINELKFGKLILKAPSAKLKDVNFSQFIFADTYFGDYQETSNVDDLNKFIACFYLLPKKSFDDKNINKNAAFIALADIVTREAIAANYLLIREWLSTAYPLIFHKQEEVSTKTKTKKKKPSGNGWIDVFDSIVGDDIINQDKYAELPVNNVFRFMTKKYKENVKKKG